MNTVAPDRLEMHAYAATARINRGIDDYLRLSVKCSADAQHAIDILLTALRDARHRLEQGLRMRAERQ